MPLETPQELVKILVEAGYSQAEIGDRAGVKQPTISRILSGEHTNPKSNVLIRLKGFVDEVKPEQREAATSTQLPRRPKVERSPSDRRTNERRQQDRRVAHAEK